MAVPKRTWLHWIFVVFSTTWAEGDGTVSKIKYVFSSKQLGIQYSHTKRILLPKHSSSRHPIHGPLPAHERCASWQASDASESWYRCFPWQGKGRCSPRRIHRCSILASEVSCAWSYDSDSFTKVRYRQTQELNHSGVCIALWLGIIIRWLQIWAVSRFSRVIGKRLTLAVHLKSVLGYNWSIGKWHQRVARNQDGARVEGSR